MDALLDLVARMQDNIHLLLIYMTALWVLNMVNWFFLGSLLNVFGILPRNILGLPGIVLSPILHGNFNHLFFNSIPLFVLANFVLLDGINAFYVITASIVIISGALVWLLGRRAIHIGASSLIMGYWSYVLIQAYYQTTIMTVLVGFISIYYFGGLLLSLLPGEEKVSWEGHVFGFIGGIATHYLIVNQILTIPSSMPTLTKMTHLLGAS